MNEAPCLTLGNIVQTNLYIQHLKNSMQMAQEINSLFYACHFRCPSTGLDTTTPLNPENGEMVHKRKL